MSHRIDPVGRHADRLAQIDEAVTALTVPTVGPGGSKSWRKAVVDGAAQSDLLYHPVITFSLALTAGRRYRLSGLARIQGTLTHFMVGRVVIDGVTIAESGPALMYPTTALPIIAVWDCPESKVVAGTFEAARIVGTGTAGAGLWVPLGTPTNPTFLLVEDVGPAEKITLIPGPELTAGAVAQSGYMMGGTASGVSSTTVDKLSFPNGNRSTIGSLLAARSIGAGFADPIVAAYTAAGFGASGSLASIERIDAATNARATLAAVLSVARIYVAGTANPTVAGYVLGGYDGTNRLTTISKLAFPVETVSAVAAGLSGGRASATAFCNPGVAGYIAGGVSTAPAVVATVDKLAFPADTRTTLATGLSAARQNCAAFSNRGVAGYVAGGSNVSSVRVTTIDRFAFPTDVRSTLAAVLFAGRSALSGFENQGVAGYMAGGNSGAVINTIDRLAYPSETYATLGSTLSSPREFVACASA